MLRLDLALPAAAAPRVLCLGAHADDIEIGCGGTVLELVAGYPDAHFDWVVLSATGARRQEAEKSAERFLAGAGSRRVVLEGFRDGFFPYEGGPIKDCFERWKGELRPDLVLTHWQHDAHQDHRLVSELTWNTFRNQLVLEYEIPKWDGDLGRPNVFVPLAEETCRRKIALLLEGFPSQRGRDWFEEETFRALLRLRGVESRAPSGYAEGFYGCKLVLATGGAAR